MKILLINDTLNKFGGVETYIYKLAHLLKEKGHKVELFGSNRKEDFSSLFSRWFSLKYYCQAKKIIKEFRPDVVHIHNCSRIISPSPILAAKHLKVPIIMTIHDFHLMCPRLWLNKKNGNVCKNGFGNHCLWSNCRSNKEGYLYFPYFWLKFLKILLHRKLVINNVNFFTAPSKSLVNYAKKNMHINRILLIPTFIPENNLKNKQQIVTNFNNLLFVGRLSREKGVDILIKAISMVIRVKPNIKLKVIGEGSDKQRLLKLTHDLMLNKYVDFTGHIDNKIIHKYFKKSAILILPSLLYEHYPLVIFESQSYGVPVLGSDTGEIPELIKNGFNGIIFKKGNSFDLASKICQILSDRHDLVEMSKNCIYHISKNYSQSSHYQYIISLYNTAINENK